MQLLYLGIELLAAAAKSYWLPALESNPMQIRHQKPFIRPVYETITKEKNPDGTGKCSPHITNKETKDRKH